MKSETQDCRKYINTQMGLFIYIILQQNTPKQRQIVIIVMMIPGCAS